MTALLLLAFFLVLAAGIGRRALGLIGTVPQMRLDAWVYSAALGLGIMAYLVLALGLLGLLTKWAVLLGCVLLAFLCWRGYVDLTREMRTCPEETGKRSWLTLLAGLVFAVVGVIVVVNCFVPPGAHEWDALSYHLAAPKVYVQNHRILYLPTDHHSNFPFLVEMLFTIGLLFDRYALANLFHFAMGALTVAAIIAIGRRHTSLTAGIIGGLVFATTPIVIWEAGAAYIELGMALFVTLAFGTALEWRETGNPRWLALAGVLIGFALSVKALALVPFFLLGLFVLLAKGRFKSLRWYLLPAILVGCPFYVKSWVWTGNPVYPFAYRIFGGRHWDAPRSAAYASEQGSFGLQSEVITPRQDHIFLPPDATDKSLPKRVRNTALAPYGLVSVPRLYYNRNDPGAFTHLGFLFLSLPPLLLLSPRRSSMGAWAMALAGLWFLAWSLTMQYVRYLMPIVPLLALAGGEGAWRLTESALRTGRFILGAVVLCLACVGLYLTQLLMQSLGVAPLLQGVTLAGCVAVLLWVTGANFGWSALLTGLVPTALLLQSVLSVAYFGGALLFAGKQPSRLSIATDSEARERYLARSVNVYGAEEWINRNTPPDAGVVLFEENRGFYLNRPYLWGNEPHSTYIPYPSFGSGAEMVDWFLSQKIRYAILTLQFSPLVTNVPGNAERLMAAVQQDAIAPYVLELYNPQTEGGEIWRRYLGEALYNGRAIILPAASSKGAVVVEFRPRPEGDQ